VLLLGLDFETTGLVDASATEVGMAFWDTDLRAPIKLTGYLVDPGPDVVWETITPEMRALGLLTAAEVSGITPELCAKYGVPDLTGLKQLLSWYRIADAIVAHNGHEFDYPLLERWAKKYGLELPDKLRIDTMCDIELPPKTIKKLVYMAADHGFLNPFPHRALFDVMTMLRIMDQYDLDKIIEAAKSPILIVKALVSFADNFKARARGFHAQYENGKFKMWSLVVKECFLERERAAAQAAGFDIEVIPKK
jgi:DNA polymerase III subunit epsilon